MAAPQALSQAELQKKALDIAAKKKKANVGKSNVISTDAVVGNVRKPGNFQTLNKTGDVVKTTAPTVSDVFKNVTKAGVPTTAPSTNSLDVRGQIADLTKQNLINRLKTTYENTRNRLAQENKQLTPQFRQVRADIDTQDTMARERTRKQLAPLGLSKSGAVAQSDTAQNVITQGARSSATELEQELRADIQRRISEAQSLRDQGIADATTEAEILKLQDRLNQIDTLKAKQEADFLATIGRFSQDYQAEINKIKNDGDPTNDWQIPFLESARQEKIQTENLDPLTGQPTGLVDMTPTAAMSLWKSIGTANKSVAKALGIPEGTVYSTFASRQAGSGGTAAPVTQTRPDTGLAGEITGYSDLKSLLDLGKASFDRTTNRQVYAPTTAEQKIRQIKNNHSNYVNQFGKEAVEQMVRDLYAETQPQDILEEGEALTEPEQYAQQVPYSMAKEEVLKSNNIDELRQTRQLMVNQAQLLIDAYTDSKFNALLKLIDDRIAELEFN